MIRRKDQNPTRDQDEIQHAARQLQTLLPRQQQTPSTNNGYPTSLVVHRSLPSSRHINNSNKTLTNNQFRNNNQQNSQKPTDADLNIEKQPYRTTPLVLPHAKTIHDIGEAQKTLASSSTENPRPYRNSSLAMAAPRTINETGIGAGPYRPYRGPQYYTDRKPVEKNPVSYNSPIRLYGKEALAEAEADQAKQANAAQNEPSAPAQESATHQMVIERELTGRPDSQISNSSDRWRPTQDPVMKDSSINQSNSFKKVMYAVMGDSDF